MITRSENTRASQNIGLVDRVLRVVVGTAMLAGGSVYVSFAGTLHIFDASTLLLMVFSLYPLMTAMIGTDPVYSFIGIRSCSDSGRNQCGTLPYQVKAMMGKAPEFCESNDDHSLENCHDSSESNPHHAVWAVDQDPMLYPDDKSMSDFAERERKLNQSHK